MMYLQYYRAHSKELGASLGNTVSPPHNYTVKHSTVNYPSLGVLFQAIPTSLYLTPEDSNDEVFKTVKLEQ